MATITNPRSLSHVSGNPLRPLRKYWLAILPPVILIFVGWFIPEFQPNEPGRLISLRQFLDPSFPAPDWLQVAGYDEDSLTVGFKILLSPLWLLTHDAIIVALLGRVIVWALLLWSLITLARAMSLSPVSLAWALTLWVGFGQSLGRLTNGFSMGLKASAWHTLCWFFRLPQFCADK